MIGEWGHCGEGCTEGSNTIHVRYFRNGIPVDSKQVRIPGNPSILLELLGYEPGTDTANQAARYIVPREVLKLLMGA